MSVFELIIFLWWASNASQCVLSLSALMESYSFGEINPLLACIIASLVDLGGLLLLSSNISAIKWIFISNSVKAFLMSCLTNFVHTSTIPLLLWLYNDVIVCWMFTCLQKCLNISDVKFLPTCDIIHFRSLYSAKSTVLFILDLMLRGCLLSFLLGI